MQLHHRFFVAVLFFAATLGLSATSGAQRPDPDTEIARRHFDRGARFYDAGNYEAAVKEFEAARSVKPSPALEFNIARCHDRLENLDLAIAGYERWLASAPAKDGGARERLAILRARRDAQLKSAQAVGPNAVAATTAVTMQPRRERYSVALPASFAAGALGAIVAGGALYGVSGARYDDHLSSGCIPTGTCDWQTTRSMERAAIGLWIAGGVLAAVDLGLWAGWRRPR